MVDGEVTPDYPKGVWVVVGLVGVGVGAMAFESTRNALGIVWREYKKVRGEQRGDNVAGASTSKTSVALAAEPVPDWTNPGRRYEQMMSRVSE